MLFDIVLICGCCTIGWLRFLWLIGWFDDGRRPAVGTLRVAQVLAVSPAVRVYCRPTPQDFVPFLRELVPSTMRKPLVASPSASMT
jgi:hypothetical protein